MQSVIGSFAFTNQASPTTFYADLNKSIIMCLRVRVSDMNQLY